MSFFRIPLLAALSIALLVLPIRQAAAQDAPVTVELQQFKVVEDEAGNEKFVDAAAVRPGDVIEYRATYRNRTDSEIDGLAAELPIPQGTQYQHASALPADIPVEAAVQAGAYAPAPLTRKVTLPDGSVREERVPYSEYRSLRWRLGELPAGEKTVVSARVQVLPLDEPSSVQAAAQPTGETSERSDL